MSQNKSWKEVQFITGVLFLIAYWYFGYDGITFSDDVTYLNFGQSFWKGLPYPDDSHFGHRWGAFIFSGFFTFIFGFSDRIGSLASLSFVLTTFILLYHQIKDNNSRFWFTLFFCTQVYFLHFSNKVYPDPILAFWVCLVPLAASFRSKSPISMALVMALSLIIGFSTKEMMVFLLPFPIILFVIDLKNKVNLKFHLYFVSFSIIILGSFFIWYGLVEGNLFARFSSVNEGHYISEFTYADKGALAILQRISYLPILTFIERSYWIWIVLALPGLIKTFLSKKEFYVEMSIATLCLLFGFWFMSSTLEFYNPIYLNPRHLIILVPILSVLIAYGYDSWEKWNFHLAGLLFFGSLVSLFQSDFQMSVYQAVFALIFAAPIKKSFTKLSLSILLLAPVILSIAYQRKNKNYQYFKNTLTYTTERIDNQYVIYTNSFVYFSQNVLLGNSETEAKTVLDIQQLNLKIHLANKEFYLLNYKYFKHAYPEEETYLKKFRLKVDTMGFQQEVVSDDPWIQVIRYYRE
ncbi:hypothetical protein A33Q_1037 [Indibacter alkaliphilus LW1]|uniref:Glycosyltransferase RgtA/B/C/D-like domain-containing protein n=1 Tax=Indibacter alkaliphilus (strain CCUG 57479 / KCTC 22604 / LW1) TaxID=1189612 RepID=S2E7X4_INDAL|nr:hypothetical protein [Indibacter alkaliphilus]EOZ98383.1 hypothetical protein A33Q_1037 [Indibacter alkaliphilus LW1]